MANMLIDKIYHVLRGSLETTPVPVTGYNRSYTILTNLGPVQAVIITYHGWVLYGVGRTKNEAFEDVEDQLLYNE